MCLTRFFLSTFILQSPSVAGLSLSTKDTSFYLLIFFSYQVRCLFFYYLLLCSTAKKKMQISKGTVKKCNHSFFLCFFSNIAHRRTVLFCVCVCVLCVSSPIHASFFSLLLGRHRCETLLSSTKPSFTFFISFLLLVMRNTAGTKHTTTKKNAVMQSGGVVLRPARQL